MQNLHYRNNFQKFSAGILLATAVALLAACGDGGTVPGATATTAATAATGTTVAVATIQISAMPATVKSDSSNTSAISVTAVSATNSTIAGATITLSTDTGLLSAQTLTTDNLGKASATFSSGTADKSNRVATITAAAGAASAWTQVQIVGSTVSATASATSITTGGAAATLTITAKDAGGSVIPNAAVTLTQTGTGTVTLTPASGTTNASGQLVVSVTGLTAGSATVDVSAAGATTSTTFTVTTATVPFGISLLTLNTNPPIVPVSPKAAAMRIGDFLVVQVSAPATVANVIFATSLGIWNGTSTSVTVPVVAGVASATLTTTSAGIANVQVMDLASQASSDTMTVGMTASTAASISLQASPTVVPKSSGSTVGLSNLTATVLDANGAPVGGAPVVFSIVKGGTNSGENISPVIVFTAADIASGLPLGVAPSVFTSGTLASGAAGVEIRASVAGTTIETTLIGGAATASSYDAAITVGGTAGSVAFGVATKIIDAGSTSTIYSWPMSVLVADSNGSPAPLGTVVNISTWPIAWSTGSGCVEDPDGKVWGINSAAGVIPETYGWIVGNGGTFYNEDANENLILDALEDGTRRYYNGGTTAPVTGTIDGAINPVNSYGGTVVSTKVGDLPGTATTDANGLATFNLTYTKASAIWVISRVRAQAVVQGTPAVGQYIARLPASLADASPSACYLPPSPFNF